MKKQAKPSARSAAPPPPPSLARPAMPISLSPPSGLPCVTVRRIKNGFLLKYPNVWQPALGGAGYVEVFVKSGDGAGAEVARALESLPPYLPARC